MFYTDIIARAAIEAGIINPDVPEPTFDEPYHPAADEVLHPPPVARVEPFIRSDQPGTEIPDPQARASTRSTARVNQEFRTPRPSLNMTVQPQASAASPMEGTNLTISEVRAVQDWDNIPNEAEAPQQQQYLVLYQEGPNTVARWENFGDIE